MKKQDLKTGMLVQTRDNDTGLVINDCIIFSNMWLHIDDYKNDLLFESGYNDELDIIKVSNVLNCHNLIPKYWIEETIDHNLLWERKDYQEMTVAQIERELGRKIKIVKDENL